jgi:hypothetical protein
MLTKKTDILRQEVEAHIKANALVQGLYWRGGKGCFIGCLTHSDTPEPAVERFGLPEPLLRLAEHVHENLPESETTAFFAAFPDAVACDGKDLTRVHWAFLAAELRALPKQSDNVQAVIDRVIAGMDALASGGEYLTAREDADAVADADWAAFCAASTAADWATAGSRASRGTAVAADAAAYAASAARAAAILRQRDLLLRLIEEAPMGDAR